MRSSSQALLLLGLMTLPCAAPAGDPVGVNEVLAAIKGNWADAQFSIDVTGLAEDNSAVTTRPLEVEYEASSKGYLTYLRVSSHGDILATSMAPASATASGTLSLPIQPPLGHERTIFLFSARPLTALLAQGTVNAPLGADRDHAGSLVRRIRGLQSQGLIVAARTIDYTVEAPQGETQYTTRSIIRMVGVQQARPIPTRVEFEFNSDRLTGRSKCDLDEFGQAMVEQLRDRKVLLVGYADSIGTDEYNLELSSRRAAATRRYLVESFGLPPRQFDAVGRGKLGSGRDTDAERAANRRVDFMFGAPHSAD